jgi:hypothetical protein
MTAEDFKFTKNSAKHAVGSLLAGAEASAVIAEGVAAGKSMDEVGADVFALMSKEEIDDLGKSIRVVNLLIQMGEAFSLGTIHEQTDFRNDGLGKLRNHAFLGYMAIAQHFIDSSPAKQWEAFFAAAETIGDVYDYFLQENEMNLEDYAYPMLGYDILFVEEVLKTRLDQKEVVGFAINQEAMNAIIAKP